MSQTLSAVLAECQVHGAGVDVTHTSLAGGKYYVPAARTEAFWEAYGRVLAAQPTQGKSALTLVECHRHVGPVVVDIDLRQHSAARLYETDDVEQFVLCLLRELAQLVQLTGEERVYVLEKEAPRRAGSKRKAPAGEDEAAAGACDAEVLLYKDGLHVVVPGVCTRPPVQHALREAMLPHVQSIFIGGDGRFVTSAKEMYDEAVIERNGWVMYGSQKPDEPSPWRLMRVLAAGGASKVTRRITSVRDVPEEVAMRTSSAEGLAELARLLSIRWPRALSVLTPHGEAEESRRLEAQLKAAEERAARAAESDAQEQEPGGEVDAEGVSELLGLLSIERAANGPAWIDVGYALRNHFGAQRAEDGLALWKAFSKRCSSKYDERAVEVTWRKIAPRPVGGPTPAKSLRSLYKWAKEDAGGQAFEHPSRGNVIQAPQDPALLRAIVDPLLKALKLDPERLRAVRNARTESGAFRASVDMDMEGAKKSMRLALDLDSLKLTVDDDDKQVVYVHQRHALEVVDCDLGNLHKDLVVRQKWQVTRPSDQVATFTTEDEPRAKIDFVNFASPEQKASAKLVFMDARKAFELSGRAKMMTLKGAYDGALKNALVTQLGLQWAVVGNNNHVTVVHNHGGGEDGGEAGAPFDVLRQKLVAIAREHRYKKLAGQVYGPVSPECPCAYESVATYVDFLNEHLGEDPLYLMCVRRHEELIKYLTYYNEKGFPNMKRDADLLSFRNGVVRLATCEFVPYADMQGRDDHPLANRVARHHIDSDYDPDNAATPLLDQVFKHQFDDDVAELLCALVGRLLFRVNQLDSWQVMPYLVGLGGTGKSIVLKAAMRFFAFGTTAALAPNREPVFGTANLMGNEAIFGMDMPRELSKTLPQELMQMMISGDAIEVPTKNITAVQVPQWTVPVILASNHMPDYINTGNNVGRRLVAFQFNNPVLKPDAALQGRVLGEELPQILCRCLRAYAAYRDKVAKAGSFWACVPPIVKEWGRDLASNTNLLDKYLSLPADERGYEIKRVEGRGTPEDAFKNAFKQHAKDQGWVKHGEQVDKLDAAVLMAHGFLPADPKKPANVCMHCNQLARSGCCALYSATDRRKKRVIMHMEMKPHTAEDDDAALDEREDE